MTSGVIINGLNTKEDLGMVMLDDLSISAPSLKSEYVDVPGMNGALDYTDALTGYPLYNMRDIGFTLFGRYDTDELTQIRDYLFKHYNGRTCDVVTPDKPGYHWHGRVTVGALQSYRGGRIPISIHAQPYRLKDTMTTLTHSLSAGTAQDISLTCEGMPTLPKYTCTSACTLTDEDGNTYSLSAGTSAQFPALMLSEDMTITAEAATAGTLTIEFQEGTL